MLNIFYGDMPDAVYNTAAYFKYDYEESWIVAPTVIEEERKCGIVSAGVI